LSHIPIHQLGCKAEPAFTAMCVRDRNTRWSKEFAISFDAGLIEIDSIKMRERATANRTRQIFVGHKLS
jgi:hypothetical protein